MGIAADGVADAHIVAVVIAPSVVLKANGREAEPGAVVGLLHQRGEKALGNQSGFVEGLGLIVGLGSLEEGLEGIGLQVGSRGRRCDELTDSGQTTIIPIAMPGIDALLLTIERHQQLIGRRIALHQSLTLQGIELRAKQVEVMKGFLHRLSLAGHILGIVACIGLIAKQVLGLLHHRVVVAQILHVGIEMGASNEIGAYADDCQQKNDGNQRFLPIEGVIKK